jgi:hypothetical protein
MYSKDLHKVLAQLLEKNSQLRPNCDDLLNNPMIIKRIDFNKNIGYEGNVQLLGTIKIANFKEINQKLPKQKKYIE